jgi:hypothetical protein
MNKKHPSHQKVKEINDIAQHLIVLQKHKLLHKKDHKVKIKILKLLHIQKSLRNYVLHKYKITT